MIDALIIIFIAGIVVSFYASHKKEVDDTAKKLEDIIE